MKEALLRHSKIGGGRRWLLLLTSVAGLAGLMFLAGVPERAAAWQGRRLLKNHQLIAAERWLFRAEKLGDDSASTLFLRARTSRKLGNIEEFAERIRKALAAGLTKETAEIEILLAEAQRGKIEGLDEQLPRLLRTVEEPDEICEAFITACLMKYRLDDAVQVLSVWQLDYPEDPRPDFFMGRILEHRDNYEAAEQSYRSAIRRSPDYTPAIYNLGRLLIVQQRPQEALSLFERCEVSLGDPRPGLSMQAQCFRLAGELPAARRAILRVDTEDREGLVIAFRAAGDASTTAIAGVFAERGHIGMAEKNFREATEFFQKAVEVNPFDWRVRYQLALAQRENGMPEAASENLKIVNQSREAMAECDKLFDVLKADPTDTEARLRIGQIFLQHVSENQGLVWISSALDYDPNYAKAHLELASYFKSRSDRNPEFARLSAMHEELALRNAHIQTDNK